MAPDPRAVLASYPEVVLNAVDAAGFPYSVRQKTERLGADGSMRVDIPASFAPVAGRASLLGHYHDDHLWNMRMALVKGRIEPRQEGWVFVTEEIPPQSQLQRMLQARRSARAYLAKRNLPWPQVNWAALDRMWAEAAQVKDP